MHLNQCEKLRLLSISYEADLPARAIKLLHRFIDRPASLLWSSERLAKSLHCSVRTIERTLKELKELGIVSIVRRRRQTVVKVLNQHRIQALAFVGRDAAKAACAAAKSLLERGKFLTRQVWRPVIHLDNKKADEEASWRVQKPANAALLRFMGLPTGEKRR